MVQNHRELQVYIRAFEASMRLFELSKNFPREEIYSLTDQMRRSSRSVAANIAEGWRKRHYQKSFVNKLVDAEGECGETQTWIEFAYRCGYISKEESKSLYNEYHEIISMLVSMRNNASKWCPNTDK